MLRPPKNGLSGWIKNIRSGLAAVAKNPKLHLTWTTWKMMTWTMASKKIKSLSSVNEVMETASEEELVFIASTNPTLLHNLCALWSLEIQLKEEGKSFKNFDN